MTEREALTIFHTIQKCRHQALHTNDCGNCERCQYRLEHEQIDGAVALAIFALEKQEQDRWIPVTERLPEKDCQCRVTEGDFKSVIDCHWSNRKKQFEVWSDYYDGYVTITNVTAWKPKEEPYTGEEA